MTTRTTLADAMQRTAQRAVEQLGTGWCIATVTATYADGTADISTGRGAISKVRRLKSYSAPAVGDVVKVDYNPDGNWVIVGALA